MRIRIWHLLLAVAVLAVTCLLVERYIHRTAVVRVTDVSAEGGRFRFGFSVTDGDSPYIQNGVASSEFGRNRFFGAPVTLTNWQELEGTEVAIRYRDRDMLWLKHRGWGRVLHQEFPDVLLFPNIEEWQANRFTKDEGYDRRVRASLTTEN